MAVPGRHVPAGHHRGDDGDVHGGAGCERAGGGAGSTGRRAAGGRLCRDELTGLDVRVDGWDIRGRWFGVVVGAAPRLGEFRRGETIPWRVIAAQLALGERAARVDPGTRQSRELGL
jgi:hypothetical protein